jgi:hypothetical protein
MVGNAIRQLIFWMKNIRDQDNIAMREISECSDGPAQVVT